MMTCHELSLTSPSPYDPARKWPVGPSDECDPGGAAFIAEWLGHVAAGRIGSPCRPTAALRAAGLATPDTIRAVTRAKARQGAADGRGWALGRRLRDGARGVARVRGASLCPQLRKIARGRVLRQ